MTARFLSPPAILCVDDDDADLDLLEEAFAACGSSFQLHRVLDGEAAIRFLGRQGPYVAMPRPNLILLDLNMPRMNGHEVLRIIKGDPSLRRIPVVVLSTSSDPREVRDCYDGGANSYICKPDDFSALVEVARSIGTFWFGASAMVQA